MLITFYCKELIVHTPSDREIGCVLYCYEREESFVWTRIIELLSEVFSFDSRSLGCMR